MASCVWKKILIRIQMQGSDGLHCERPALQHSDFCVDLFCEVSISAEFLNLHDAKLRRDVWDDFNPCRGSVQLMHQVIRGDPQQEPNSETRSHNPPTLAQELCDQLK
ncbi:MAG: hypothetical protein WCA37_12720 [Terracidiphilus sp.]